jgi:hypothetical protein
MGLVAGAAASAGWFLLRCWLCSAYWWLFLLRRSLLTLVALVTGFSCAAAGVMPSGGAASGAGFSAAGCAADAAAEVAGGAASGRCWRCLALLRAVTSRASSRAALSSLS